MANAKKCDICGEFYAASKVNQGLRAYDFRDTNVVILIHVNPNSGATNDQPTRTEEMEACPTCMRKIEALIDDMKA